MGMAESSAKTFRRQKNDPRADQICYDSAQWNGCQLLNPVFVNFPSNDIKLYFSVLHFSVRAFVQVNLTMPGQSCLVNLG
jgi:hypothetical protein